MVAISTSRAAPASESANAPLRDPAQPRWLIVRHLFGSYRRFLAITGYFSLAFSVVTALGVAATLRAGPAAHLPTAVGSLQAFGSLWWLAAAVTATKRGQQAAGAGEPEGSARDAVIGLSWVELALYLAGTAAVIYDRCEGPLLCMDFYASNAVTHAGPTAQHLWAQHSVLNCAEQPLHPFRAASS